jgi:hypothetical protein
VPLVLISTLDPNKWLLKSEVPCPEFTLIVALNVLAFPFIASKGKFGCCAFTNVSPKRLNAPQNILRVLK